MKKMFIAIGAALLVTALSIPARADFDHPVTMYATKKKVEIYKSADKDSDTLKTLNISDPISAVDVSKNGKWYKVTWKNKSGKKKTGWIQAKYLTEDLDPSLCRHDWSAWDVVRDATCTKQGKQVRECMKCGKEEEKVIKKKEHEWGKWKVTKEASCTAEGEREHTCKNCGETEVEIVPKAAHDWDKWVVKKEATCTAEGALERKCKVCGAKEKGTTKKLPHKWGKWETTKEATCTAEGERKRECKNCDEVQKEKIKKVPHTYGKWEVTTKATNHSSGVKTKTCSVCGYKKTKDYDPKGTLRRGARGDNVREVQQLLVDQKYLAEGAADGVFGRGTETAISKFQADQGFTADGIAWPQTIKKLQHVFGSWTIDTVPTRSTEGLRSRTCETCGFREEERFSAGQVFTRGTRGEEIRVLQTMLDDLNLDAGTADGIYGPRLDRAFTRLAADAGLSFAGGLITPFDTDLLVNTWLAAQPEDQAAAEELVLTVVPAEKADGVPEGWLTFDWTLKNAGTEECSQVILLLAFGEAPDFRGDTLTVHVGGGQLPAASSEKKKDSKKEKEEKEEAETGILSGSFCVDPAWGEGNLNFRALASAGTDGALRLSNTVVHTAEPTAEPMNPE